MATVGFMPNCVELKAERRKPSGEKPCDIVDTPSLTGVLAHFRLHEFNTIRLYAGGAMIRRYQGEGSPFLLLPPRGGRRSTIDLKNRNFETACGQS
jgi:hypothetical protein